MENITLNPESFMAFVGMFGPLLVAAITGLKTSAKVKALLAIAVVAIATAITAIGQGGFTGDVFAGILMVVPIWQGFYTMLWKNTEVAAWLQANIPIKFGEPSEDVDTPVEG